MIVPNTLTVAAQMMVLPSRSTIVLNDPVASEHSHV